ncbi:MAG: DUF5615 family PIN-like protein [Acidimicrobiaceae bacterium]|nr:DUF5615 family PIN-like protein [Acidimicrobiaceae bacterium]
MRSSLDRPRDIRCCLDANISPRAAAGIDNVIHVSEVDALSRTHGSHSNADDYDIAVWCAENSYVLVTCDNDFRSRRQRTQSIQQVGVEVIIFTYELAGLANHVSTIARRIPLWEQKLKGLGYAPRVWLQARRGTLREDRPDPASVRD